ncbi:MAG: magnesium transporter [Promethearchaeota archaeon]|jgi:mgtE-like transporter
MKYFIKIFKESIVIVVISSIIGLFSGTVLSFNEEVLYTFPILLLILPALNSLIGDISTVLVARLTTHLYVGTLPPKIQKTKRIVDDFYGLIATLLLGFIFLVILGYGLGIVTGIQLVNPLFMISIILLTITIIFLLMFILLFLGAIFLFKRGMDPNNFLIPFVTSLADFLTPLFLIIFIIIFL